MIRPCPGGLKHARGRVPTTRGPIEVDWNDEAAFTMSVTLPEGVTANLDVPAADETTGVLVNGKSVQATKANGRWIVSEPITGTVSVEVK